MMLGLPRHGMIIAAGGGLPFAIDGGSIGVMPMRQPQPFAPDRASNGGRMWGRFGRRGNWGKNPGGYPDRLKRIGRLIETPPT